MIPWALIAIAGLWLALIVFAFCLCRAADRGDDMADRAFRRTPGGWRH